MGNPDRTVRPMPITYILPDLTWSVLLDPIAREAPPGSVIETHTVAMQELVERTLREHGRSDVTVRLGRDPQTSAPPAR